MKLCIYAGTFNPIHTAHLIAAQTIKDEIKADKIVLIPSYIPPHKQDQIAHSTHRMNMLKLAIKDNPDFIVSDIEFQRNGKSYTYDTIKELYAKNKSLKEKICFIIGTDAFKKLDSWHEIKKLIKLVKFIVIPREDHCDISKIRNEIPLENIDFEFINAPFVDISSSQIRQKIKENKSIKYLVTKEVEDYINTKELFRD